MSSRQTQGPPSTTNGPKLLEERSIGGIFVHFVAIPTGVIGAGLVYLVTTNEFTRQNARNALDWHLTVLALTVITFGSLFTYAELTGQGVTDSVVLPSPLTTVAGVGIPVLVSFWMLVTLWTFVVGFIAMGKATFGTVWRYPLTPALVERFVPRVALPSSWPLLICTYTILAPLIVGTVFVGPRDGALFIASGFAMVGLIMVLTPFTGVAMYLHGERTRPADAKWQPSVVVYIGVPTVVGVAAYTLAASLIDSINPAGDAMYVFLAAFWVSSLVYVVRWLTTKSE